MLRPRFRSLLLALTLLLGLAGSQAPGARADLAVGSTAIVATTEGDLLSLRAGPGVGYPLVSALPQGTVLDVLAGPATASDGTLWYQVRAGKLTGWSIADYLAPPQASTPAPATSPTPAAPTATERVTVLVGGTDGGGARLRDTPALTGAIITTIADGETVTITGATQSSDGYDWAPVEYAGTRGWVVTIYLLTASQTNPATPTTAPAPTPVPAPASTPTPPPAPASPPATTPAADGLAAGQRASVVNTGGLDLRIRGDAGTDAPILDYAPAGAVLLITAGPKPDHTGALWYGIDYDGSRGWVFGLFLTPTTAPPSPRGATPQPTPTATPATPPPTTAPASPPASSSPTPPPASTPAPATPAPANRGQAVANVALHYVGVKYVWGGATPAGWDCSGMVGYVYREATGLALPRTAVAQFTVGTPVAANAIQAGDIVFFTDTNGPGITHNGIALGDGRFVHARSENYGTIVSSLADPYWVSHFAGARRP